MRRRVRARRARADRDLVAGAALAGSAGGARRPADPGRARACPRASGSPVGTLNLYCEPPRAWDESEIEALDRLQRSARGAARRIPAGASARAHRRSAPGRARQSRHDRAGDRAAHGPRRDRRRNRVQRVAPGRAELAAAGQRRGRGSARGAPGRGRTVRPLCRLQFDGLERIGDRPRSVRRSSRSSTTAAMRVSPLRERLDQRECEQQAVHEREDRERQRPAPQGAVGKEVAHEVGQRRGRARALRADRHGEQGPRQEAPREERQVERTPAGGCRPAGRRRRRPGPRRRASAARCQSPPPSAFAGSGTSSSSAAAHGEADECREGADHGAITGGARAEAAVREAGLRLRRPGAGEGGRIVGGPGTGSGSDGSGGGGEGSGGVAMRAFGGGGTPEDARHLERETPPLLGAGRAAVRFGLSVDLVAPGIDCRVQCGTSSTASGGDGASQRWRKRWSAPPSVCCLPLPCPVVPDGGVPNLLPGALLQASWEGDGHDPRRLDVLHLRRTTAPFSKARTASMRTTRAFSPARPDDQRGAADAALDRQGRVLRGGVLPAQPARRRARCRTSS